MVLATDVDVGGVCSKRQVGWRGRDDKETAQVRRGCWAVVLGQRGARLSPSMRKVMLSSGYDN